MPVSKDTLVFIQNPTIHKWASSLPSEKTRLHYSYHLKRFLSGIKKTPEDFLAEVEKNPRQMSIDTKSFLGSFPSKATARIMMNATKSFVRFYEAPLPLNGLRIHVPRTRRKPYLSWIDAERIIGAAKEPYRSAFRFLLWGGIGLDELAEIQHSSEIRTDIERQRDDQTKPYMRIDLRPRKSNTDSYYILTPKQHVPKFPVVTLDYGNRGGELVGNLAMETNWTRACKRVGLHQPGLGPHTLRSAYRSQCAKVGVADAVAEFQMGHGSRDVHGYSRETDDESYVAAELTKLWNAATPVTAADLKTQNETIAKLNDTIMKLEEKLATAKQVEASQGAFRRQDEMWALVKAQKVELDRMRKKLESVSRKI